MTGVPEEERTDAGEAHERSTRDEFRAQVHARRVEIERQFESSKAQFDQAQERIRARTGRNLLVAILIGLAFGGTVLLSLLVVKELFLVFAVVIAGFASSELAQALRKGRYQVPRVATVVAAVAVVPAAYFFGATGQIVAVLVGMLFVSVWRIVEQGSRNIRAVSGGLGRDLVAGVFVQAYVTFLASFAVVLTAADDGQFWTLAFIVIAVAADTGAYSTGLMIGRHPMAPVISPKKTWEGFGGGALASIVAGVLLSTLLLQNTWWFGIVFGIAIFLSATLGDLVESLIKRDLGVKDMSSWLPGHGGFLDRLDSILPSAAVAYVAFLVFG